MAFIYKAGFARSACGSSAAKYVGVVLKGDAESSFPPSTLEKRLSQKGFQTKADALEFAQGWVDKHYA